MRLPRLLLLLPAASALVLTACRDQQIRTYSAPKDTAPTMPALPTASTDSAVPAITWQTPTDWQEQTGNSVRVGSFLVTAPDGRKADISVTTFPGNVGGDLANLNRWRAQLQLAPITESDLANTARSLDLPTGHFQLIDFSSDALVIDGKYKGRILGAWLKQPDRVWFFKITGETALVGQQQAAFDAFLRSVQFAPATTTATANPPLPMMPPQPFSSPTSMDSAAGLPPTSPSSALTWLAPTDWPAKPLGQMRKGSFTLPGGSAGDADLSITSFPGAAGGLLDNLNRWRGQLQLAPLTAAELPAHTTLITHDSLSFTVIEFASTGEKPTRLLAAILPYGDESYFFKLTGPDAVVLRQREAFLAFLHTVKSR